MQARIGQRVGFNIFTACRVYGVVVGKNKNRRKTRVMYHVQSNGAIFEVDEKMIAEVW